MTFICTCAYCDRELAYCNHFCLSHDVQMINDVAKDLFIEVIDDMVRHLSVKFVEALILIKNAPVVSNQLITEEVSKLSHMVAMETIKEERYNEARRKEEEK